MPEPTCDPPDAGFAFTDEDFARRYSSRTAPATSDAAASGTPTQAAAGRRLHGVGNSFMRARRRRAASPAPALAEMTDAAVPAR